MAIKFFVEVIDVKGETRSLKIKAPSEKILMDVLTKRGLQIVKVSPLEAGAASVPDMNLNEKRHKHLLIVIVIGTVAAGMSFVTFALATMHSHQQATTTGRSPPVASSGTGSPVDSTTGNRDQTATAAQPGPAFVSTPVADQTATAAQTEPAYAAIPVDAGGHLTQAPIRNETANFWFGNLPSTIHGNLETWQIAQMYEYSRTSDVWKTDDITGKIPGLEDLNSEVKKSAMVSEGEFCTIAFGLQTISSGLGQYQNYQYDRGFEEFTSWLTTDVGTLSTAGGYADVRTITDYSSQRKLAVSPEQFQVIATGEKFDGFTGGLYYASINHGFLQRPLKVPPEKAVNLRQNGFVVMSARWHELRQGDLEFEQDQPSTLRPDDFCRNRCDLQVDVIDLQVYDGDGNFIGRTDSSSWAPGPMPVSPLDVQPPRNSGIYTTRPDSSDHQMHQIVLEPPSRYETAPELKPGDPVPQNRDNAADPRKKIDSELHLAKSYATNHDYSQAYKILVDVYGRAKALNDDKLVGSISDSIDTVESDAKEWFNESLEAGNINVVIQQCSDLASIADMDPNGTAMKSMTDEVLAKARQKTLHP